MEGSVALNINDLMSVVSILLFVIMLYVRRIGMLLNELVSRKRNYLTGFGRLMLYSESVVVGSDGIEPMS